MIFLLKLLWFAAALIATAGALLYGVIAYFGRGAQGSDVRSFKRVAWTAAVLWASWVVFVIVY